MVFTIQPEGAESFTFDLEQNDVIFLLNYAHEHAIGKKEPDVSEKPAEIDVYEDTAENFTEKKKYKGFMLIRCDECGELKGFCAKEPIDSYYCKNCEHKTPLNDLMVLYQDCDCGKHFKYLTNEKAESITHSCISCGMETEMVLNNRRTAYVTKKKKRPKNVQNYGFAWSRSGDLFKGGVTA